MLHLERFVEYRTAACGHDRLSWVVPWDVFGWRDHRAGWPGPVNHHLASVSGFLAWVVAQGCGPVPEGNPAAGVRTLVVAPPGPGARTPARVRCRAEVT